MIRRTLRWLLRTIAIVIVIGVVSHIVSWWSHRVASGSVLELSLKGPLIERGFAYGEAGDFSSATEDLTRALRIEPSNARALTLRGAAYAKLGLHAKAIAASATGAASSARLWPT